MELQPQPSLWQLHAAFSQASCARADSCAVSACPGLAAVRACHPSAEVFERLGQQPGCSWPAHVLGALSMSQAWLSPACREKVHDRNSGPLMARAMSTLNSKASCSELYPDILCTADWVKAIIYMDPEPLNMLLGGQMLRQRGFAEQKDSRAQLAAPWWPVWESPADNAVALVMCTNISNAQTHHVQHIPLCCSCLWLRRCRVL